MQPNKNNRRSRKTPPNQQKAKSVLNVLTKKFTNREDTPRTLMSTNPTTNVLNVLKNEKKHF